MRIIFYYRCADQRLIDAKQQDNVKGIAVQEAGEAFAKLFNAHPVYTQGFNPHLAGITFNRAKPPVNWLLWTQPTRENPCMLPRTPEGVPKKLKQLAQGTHDMFRKLWPTEAGTPYHSALLAAMGISPQAVLGNALSYFYHPDKDGINVSWIASSLPLDGKSLPVEGQESQVMEGWYEVIASEFAVANDEFNHAQFLKQQGQAANEEKSE